MTKPAFEKIAEGLLEVLERARKEPIQRWMALDRFAQVDGCWLRAWYCYEVDPVTRHILGDGHYEWRELATGRLYRGADGEAAAARGGGEVGCGVVDASGSGVCAGAGAVEG